MTPEQIAALLKSLAEIQANNTKLLTDYEGAAKLIKTLQDDNAKFKGDLDGVRKQLLKRGNESAKRASQAVTPDCARYLASIAFLGAEKHEKLGHLSAHQRDSILGVARECVGIEAKAAIASGDIPLPTEYNSEVVELVYTYGSFRKYATNFPLGTATVKLPKLTTSPAFGFISASAAIGEKVPQVGFVDFTAKKAGGIVRIPSEIEADSIVGIGQFIARYIARETAKWEDTVGFRADGSGTYNALSGVCKTADTLGFKVQLANGSTKPSQIALTDLRNLRATIDAAALAGAAYYMHPSMEVLLSSLNTANYVPYVAMGPNGPTFEGFPIRWIGVMPVYDTAAHINQYQVAFGDLSYWYFGERGSLRVETSSEVYFATDEIGIRALERFDVQLMANQAAGVLQLAAA